MVQGGDNGFNVIGQNYHSQKLRLPFKLNTI